MKHGFVKVAAGTPEIKVADTQFNIEEIEKLVLKAHAQGVEILLTPELGITGSTCQDLFFQQTLIDNAEVALMKLMDFTRSMDMIIVVGMPIAWQRGLLNCAVVIQKGKIQGVVAKKYLSGTKGTLDGRWFDSVDDAKDAKVWICGELVEIRTLQLFSTPSCTFAIELGQDFLSPMPPSATLSLIGADIILNPSAQHALMGKTEELKQMIIAHSARCTCGYVHAGCGFGESTTDLLFAGQSFICENGTILAENIPFATESQLIVSEIDIDVIRSERRSNKSFVEAARTVQNMPHTTVNTDMMVRQDQLLSRTPSAHPFYSHDNALRSKQMEEIFCLQTMGLAKRMKHTNCKTVVLGISGGLDSTLALLVCIGTFDRLGLDRKGIVGVTMPGFGTTDHTYQNALTLMKQLGITLREVSIKEACLQHFSDIGHKPDNHDVTYENSQARERTQILMDIANKVGGMVVGTGDLSELALGWATYNGDHMSMYSVNGSVPKTVVKLVVEWYANSQSNSIISTTLKSIIDTPISPELIPADENGEIRQKTEDLVGPYELHDFFLYHILRYGFRPAKIYLLAQYAFANSQYNNETIKNWLTIFYRRFFNQQFKRSCLPDGPKVGICSLSPRGDWSMPSDAVSQGWLKECEAL